MVDDTKPNRLRRPDPRIRNSKAFVETIDPPCHPAILENLLASCSRIAAGSILFTVAVRAFGSRYIVPKLQPSLGSKHEQERGPPRRAGTLSDSSGPSDSTSSLRSMEASLLTSASVNES